MEKQESENSTIKYIYLSRSSSLKKAQKVYRENNREKINEIHKRYYDRVKSDPEWKKKQSERKKEYYQRKKLERKNLAEDSI